MSTLELGVIGNCAVASLIDRRGRHVWHGLGRLDGDPVFNALLGDNDPQGGYREVAVSSGKEGRQRYGGWLSGVLDRDMADASSLVLPEIGLLRSDDPHFHATLDVIGKRLTKNVFLMRYVEADDSGKPSNAFLLCMFWYIDALASVGRRDEALELFNNVLGRHNHVGLLSEDIDPKTGELWGNFPQTYSQVGLILSAMRLSRTWEEGLWHAS
jgi:GH15 family glucan-1,4-alpha-glucosidase